MLRVLTPARSLRLTTPERVATELGADDASAFADLVKEVSSDIESFIGYRLVRERVRETVDGDGTRTLFLTRTPVAALEASRFESSTVSDVSVVEPGSGELYRQDRFTSTQPLDIWVRPSVGAPPGEPTWEFDYWGGYLTRDDDTRASGTAVAHASEQEFELTSGTWPYLVSGDIVDVAGFSNDANNGRMEVLARVSPTRLRVAAALVGEVNSGVATFEARNLPGELERAVLDEIKTRHLSRSRASDITSERIGDWSASYGGTAAQATQDTYGFADRRTADKLNRWRRAT